MCYAQALSKPGVTLPANWELSTETAYPESVSEHDSAGAGLLEYQSLQTYDYVMIYYEKATTSYTSAELKAEVTRIFSRDERDLTISESGTTPIAGVQAGFAKSYDTEYDVYCMEVVFVKGQYYVNAFAVYEGTQRSNDAVMSLLNSISSDSSAPSDTMLFALIGIVAAVVIVVVVVFVLRGRKKRAAVAVSPLPPYPGNLSPPP